MVVSPYKQVKVLASDVADVKKSNISTALALVVLTVSTTLFAIDVVCQDLLSINNKETGAAMSFVIFVLLMEVFVTVCYTNFVTKTIVRTLQVISCVALKVALLKIESLQKEVEAAPSHFGFVLMCGILFGCFLIDLTEIHSQEKACILVVVITAVLCTMVPDLMFNKYQTWNNEDQWFLILTPILVMLILACITKCNLNNSLLLLVPLGTIPMLYVFIPCLHINNIALKTTMIGLAVIAYSVVIAVKKSESEKVLVPTSEV